MVVYALSDPKTDELRYIGQTEQLPATRLRQHVKDCGRYSNHCAHWIKNLKKQGFKPFMEILQKCSTVEELNEAEIYWISQFRALGFRLTNISHGGENTTKGTKLTAKNRLAIAASLGSKPFRDHLGNVYFSKSEAQRKLGIARQQINKVLSGKERQAKGYTFRYLEEQTQSSTLERE